MKRKSAGWWNRCVKRKIYFSYSGTAKGVANAISKRTGADLFEIKTKKEYSNVYTESNRESRKNEKPELADAVEQLETYDWKGKLIIPFCISGESDINETMPTFLNSCEGLAVHEGR